MTEVSQARHLNNIKVIEVVLYVVNSIVIFSSFLLWLFQGRLIAYQVFYFILNLLLSLVCIYIYIGREFFFMGISFFFTFLRETEEVHLYNRTDAQIIQLN